MNITSLGEARFPSPVPHTVSDQARIPAVIVRDPVAPKQDEVLFELAGPRAKMFFDPAKTRAGIITCGGLCPGLNNVIRALFLELHHTYGVAEVLGFRGGYQGLDPACGPEPMVIAPAFVDQIHQHGGTILGTSRGPVDTAAAVDNLLWHDPYSLLANYRSCVDCRDQVSALWTNQQARTCRSIANVPLMGKFSSERSVDEYCEQI